MFYNSATKTYIQMDTAFTLNDVQYPPNWLRLASAEDKAAIGLQEVVTIGARGDDKLFFVSEEYVGAELRITNIPRPEPTSREKALAVILELEAQANSPRLVREAALGITESVQILSGIQTLIEAERLKL